MERKSLFSCVGTKVIFFSSLFSESEGEWITHLHTWLIFVFCDRSVVGWGLFDSGDLLLIFRFE